MNPIYSRELSRWLGTDHADRTPPLALVDAVKQVSDGLIKERQLVGTAYLNTQLLREAYQTFWWPMTYLHAATILGHAVELEDGARVLDLGVGGGSCSAAALDLANRNGVSIHLTALDHASEALGALETLLKPRLGGSTLNTSALDLEFMDSTEQFDLIMLGHVLNELFTHDPNRDQLLIDFVNSTLERLKPNGKLVIIEPALRETSRTLHRVRDQVLSSGASVVAPCTYQGPCPALQDNDWCHTSLSWEPPVYIQKISNLSGIDRTRLAFSYLVLTQTPQKRDAYRIVSEPLHTKGRLRYLACGPEGRFPLVAPESRVKGENEVFRRLPPGDLIEFGAGLQKGDGLDISKTWVRRMGSQDEPL